jgi:hypothetical protein
MSLFGLGAAPPLTRADEALVRKIAKALANLIGSISSLDVDVPHFLHGEHAERMADGAAASVELELKHFYHILRSTPRRHRLKVAAAIVELWPYSAFIALTTADLTRNERARLDEISGEFPYPCVPIERRAKVVLGESPESQSYVLTRKQAHLWFSCYPDGRWVEDSSEWYLLKVLGMPTGSYDYQSIFNQRRGLDWFTGVWNDPVRKEAMFRERVVLGPEGELRGSFWSRLDELEVQDLTQSVERTFRNAVDRLVAEQQEGYEKDDLLTTIPYWWVGSKYVELLVTPRQLADEGREMAHCAGMYVGRVAHKHSIIVSIETNTCRSTVELDPQTLRVKQHVGFGNEPPHPDCEKVLEVHLDKWAKAAGPSADRWPGPGG